MKVSFIFLWWYYWTSSILVLASLGAANTALLSSIVHDEQRDAAVSLRGLSLNKKPQKGEQKYRGKHLDLDLYEDAINAILYGNYTPAETKQIIDHVGRNFVRADVVDPEKTGLTFAFDKPSSQLTAFAQPETRKLREVSCKRGRKHCACPGDGPDNCVCTEGYESDFNDGERDGCRDYDECTNAYPCAPYVLGGFCVDTDPDDNLYPMYKCGCDPNRGFLPGSTIDPIHGPLSCVSRAFIDTDECSTGEHDCDSENGICTNEPLGTFTCSCNENFELSDGNECTAVVIPEPCNGHCKNNQICDVSDGKCVCVQGFFAPSGRGGACQQILNCDTANGGCDENAECTERDNDILCTCPDGYKGDGLQCTENNECTNGFASCDANAECINFDGGFACVCQDGFQDASSLHAAAGTACTDLDECALKTDNCDTNAECQNTLGSFTCSCNFGFNGDGINCGANVIETVVNVPSTSGSSGSNANQDQCTPQTNDCHPDATCTDTDTGLKCVCNTNFFGNGITSCLDSCVAPFVADASRCVLLECKQTKMKEDFLGTTNYNLIFLLSTPVTNDFTTLTVLLQGDFDGSDDNERVRLRSVNGGMTKTLLNTDNVSDCATVPQNGGSVTLSENEFNALINSGQEIEFQVRARNGVSQCEPGSNNGGMNNIFVVLTTLREPGYSAELGETCVTKECLKAEDCGAGRFCITGENGEATCQADQCQNSNDCTGATGEVCLQGEIGVGVNRCYTPGVCDATVNPGFESIATNSDATQLVITKDLFPTGRLAHEDGVFVTMPFEFDFFFIDGNRVFRNLYVSKDGVALVLDSNDVVQGILDPAFGGPRGGTRSIRIYTLEKGDSFLISWESKETGEFQIELFADGRFNFVWGKRAFRYRLRRPFLSGFGDVDDIDAGTFHFTEGPDFFIGEAQLWPTDDFRCHAESNLPCLVDSDCDMDALCVTDADFSTNCVSTVACPTVANGPTFASIASNGNPVLEDASAGDVSATIPLPFYFKFRGTSFYPNRPESEESIGEIVVGASGDVYAPWSFTHVDGAWKRNLDGGTVYTLNKGGDSFLISWEGLKIRDTDTTTLNFQLEFFKDGRIIWMYGEGALINMRSVVSHINIEVLGSPNTDVVVPVEIDEILVTDLGDIEEWPTNKFACATPPFI